MFYILSANAILDLSDYASLAAVPSQTILCVFNPVQSLKANSLNSLYNIY